MDRQKLLLIFGAAWVSAALLVWFLYSATKAPHVEKTVAVIAAARDMPAGTLLRKSDLKTVTLLERELPKTAIREQNLAINRPLLFPVSTNEPLTGSKIAALNGIEGLAATIEIGMRAITVPITDTNSVAGLEFPPRAHVDRAVHQARFHHRSRYQHHSGRRDRAGDRPRHGSAGILRNRQRRTGSAARRGSIRYPVGYAGTDANARTGQKSWENQPRLAQPSRPNRSIRRHRDDAARYWTISAAAADSHDYREASSG